ncbi:MAG: sulfatase family protein [Streptosporangiales bacterium]
MSRRRFLSAGGGLVAGGTALQALDRSADRAPRGSGGGATPNFVYIMLDDAGVGDLDPDNPQIRTPHVTRLAEQGMTFTQMYCGSSVCSPSRAALLTGRYPVRVGIPRVLEPSDDVGLSRWERTIAELLRDQGYATGVFGKWHLGFRPWFNPVHHGFDRFVGVMHSGFHRDERVRVYEGTTRPEHGMDQAYLTRRFTDAALDFIRAQHRRRKPFFAYIPYTAPHLPLHVEPRFAGKSAAGRYGDVVQEVDFHIGRVLDTLEQLHIADETVVVVTSDNGPWFQGSTNGLRGRKAQSYEGGVRAPFYIRWPGYIPAGSKSDAIASFLDMLPTFCRIAGAEVPRDRPIDGIDLRPALRGRPMPTRPPLAYFKRWHLAAIRYKQWKLMIPRKDQDHARQLKQLFNIDRDPLEQYDQGATHRQVESRLEAMAAKIRKEIDQEKPAAMRRARRRGGPKPQGPENIPAFGAGLGALVTVLLGLGLWAGYGRRSSSRTRARIVSWAVVVLGVVTGLVALGMYLT